MGFFDWMFGKPRSDAPSPEADGEDGPPEFVRAVALQRAYWKHDAEEQSRLEAQPRESLSWPERLRLHHLFCMQRLEKKASSGTGVDDLRSLLAPESPYRPRPALVWTGPPNPAESDRPPEMQGEFLNASITHFGCLEVIRVDAGLQPTRLDFVGFDELSGVVFAAPNLMRAARLFYDDGSSEIVFAPLLYGLTWKHGNEYDRNGSMTRFEAHWEEPEAELLGASGVGLGQQDFFVRGPEGARLFGLGATAEIAFPLDVRDLRFDAKARARGVDPEEARRSMGMGPVD